MAHSPYLNEPNRLAEVLSAIQVMGTYKFYKLDFSGWADRINGDKNQADHWGKNFEEHPEFFFDWMSDKKKLLLFGAGRIQSIMT